MDCIILAGGLGTRLRTEVPGIPKALAPVCGVPFIRFLLQELWDTGLIRRFLLAVGYQSDAIEQELASFPVPIVYVHEKTPLGTGGAIAQAMRQVESQTALILNGDVYVEFDLATFYAAHQAKRAQVSLVCCPVDDAERYGTVVLGAEGEVVAFREKVPGKGYVNGGVYLFEQTIAMPEQTTFSIERDFFPRLIGHRFFGHISEGIFIDIGTPPSYRLAQELLRNKVCLYRTY